MTTTNPEAEIAHLTQEIAKAQAAIDAVRGADVAGERSKHQNWIAMAKEHIAELENGIDCHTHCRR